MNDLLRLLPPIRRTRGARLYAADGKRFLDLWLDDGRGMLGERDRLARTHASNAADKGLTRPYPGLYDERLRKAVEAVWRGFSVVRCYLSEERALAEAARLLGAPVLGDATRLVDSAAWSTGDAATGDLPTDALYLARPLSPVPEAARLVMPRLPCPRAWAPAILAARPDSELGESLAASPGDLVPAQGLVAAARGLASLSSAARDGYGEEAWRRSDRRLAPYFERRGPYLVARIERERYEGFFRAALAGGALIAPTPDAPSVLSPDWDDGELARLAKALAAFISA